MLPFFLNKTGYLANFNTASLKRKAVHVLRNIKLKQHTKLIVRKVIFQIYDFED